MDRSIYRVTACKIKLKNLIEKTVLLKIIIIERRAIFFINYSQSNFLKNLFLVPNFKIVLLIFKNNYLYKISHGRAFSI